MTLENQLYLEQQLIRAQRTTMDLLRHRTHLLLRLRVKDLINIILTNGTKDGGLIRGTMEDTMDGSKTSEM